MKKKILVVDDEKDIVDILKYNLERENEFEVITASNGKEALEAAQSLPDLILLDIMMPELNGFEVCKRLKNDKLTSGIPVIFLTAKEN
ncbi:MAG: response regulator [Ignavibacteria bacterium]